METRGISPSKRKQPGVEPTKSKKAQCWLRPHSSNHGTEQVPIGSTVVPFGDYFIGS